ncbi:MAG: tRNA epoxyqueuosine(34) reductase QueG [Alistipes sp.]|nr:tRNA epoxyqueuosine(34) reductase QueG [Alistipes sp.]
MISRKVITDLALDCGFDLVGVVRAEHLSQEHNRFKEWVLEGNSSTLTYLERNVEKRFDASLLVEGSRSVVVCAVSYLSPYSRGYAEGSTSKIASYALNRDYHLTIKSMLEQLASALMVYAPEMRHRSFVDSAPLAEKSYARRAGLGWIGRQSLLVNPKFGSMMHLGELVIDVDVDEYDTPMEGVGCGSCRRCVEACPNRAILDNRTIDTRRCISCRTIEREDDGDTTPLHGWIFGCDICQSVCPFNAHAPLHRNPQFDPVITPEMLSAERLETMTDEEFATIAKPTPLLRAGFERIKANAKR